MPPKSAKFNVFSQTKLKINPTTNDGSRVIPSRPRVLGKMQIYFSAGAGGSDVRYGLRRCPFTLNSRPVLMSEMSTTPSSKNSRTTYGPSHLERSFPGKSLRREL